MRRYWLGLVAAAVACAADPGEGVSRELARERSAAIGNVRYHYSLTLEPGAARLRGHAVIRFDAAAPPADLPVDFRDLDSKGQVTNGTVSALRVNAKPATARQVSGHLVLPAALLNRGANALELDFETSAAPAGRPITRVTDREDGSEYLYTLFVPMDASVAFPCFDQPDLKARFTFEATAPDAWQVISNTPEQGREPAGAGRRRIRFQETQPISTYLFAFAAGPFEMLPATGAGSPPMRLWMRRAARTRALAEWPQVEQVTLAGMRQLTDFFAEPFPFPKYDQVLIPGLAYGGMEHAGATFLREESIVFRTVPTAGDRARRSALLLHELAHQWFGDLVTMRWFDDLWLKEGFATYMAYRALSAMEPAAEVWKRFYLATKPAAYAIDATRGTTPIHQQVPNLNDAKSAYGAIVYSKAPGVLRSLSFTIGEEAFRGGVRLFLKEHRWANAEWADLVDAFSRAAGRDLKPWAAAWIERRGMPEVEALWECGSDARIRRFDLQQRDVLNERKRWPLRTQVLLGFDPGEPVRLDAALEQASGSLAGAMGKPCPAFVFLNGGDHGYGRFLLDTKSRDFALARVGSIADPLERALLWGALWDEVRESRLSPGDYVAAAIRSLPEENDAELAASLLGRVGFAFTRYLAGEERIRLGGKLEELYLDRMKNARTADLRIGYFRALAGAATQEQGLRAIRELLDGRLEIPGVPLKAQDRWSLVTALAARGGKDAPERIAAESRRDETEDGRRHAYAAGAALPEAAAKERYFKDYTSGANVREDWIEASLGAFNAWDQTGITKPYLEYALATLPKVKRERKIFFVLAWLNSFVGGQQDADSLRRVDTFLESAAMDADLRRKVLEVRDELDRTVRIRDRWAGPPDGPRLPPPAE